MLSFPDSIGAAKSMATYLSAGIHLQTLLTSSQIVSKAIDLSQSPVYSLLGSSKRVGVSNSTEGIESYR